MPNTTNFREIRIADGEYAAVDQNRINAQRGTFVESDGGGQVTPGTSTSDVTLNAEATEFRADLTPYNLNQGQPAVTLSPNETPYPRRDLVLARVPQNDGGTPSYDTLEGEPIDKDTNATLVEAGVIDDDGIPIAPVASIPEVQPPEALGLLNEATLLAMVYVPPGTRDATDLTDDYITDLREPGSGVVDVLRTGDAIEEVESHDATLDATTASAAGLELDDDTLRPLLQAMPNGEIELQPIPAGDNVKVRMNLADSTELHYYGHRISRGEGEITVRAVDGQKENTWEDTTILTPDSQYVNPGGRVEVRLTNTGNSTVSIGAVFSYAIFPIDG